MISGEFVEVFSILWGTTKLILGSLTSLMSGTLVGRNILGKVAARLSSQLLRDQECLYLGLQPSKRRAMLCFVLH